MDEKLSVGQTNEAAAPWRRLRDGNYYFHGTRRTGFSEDFQRKLDAVPESIRKVVDDIRSSEQGKT